MNPLNELINQIEIQELWEPEIVLKRNEFLVEKGSTNTNFFLVLEGSMRIFVVDAAEEHTIRFGYRGNLIAALDSFLNEAPTELNIQALKKARLKAVQKKNLMKMVHSNPKNTTLWISILENFARQQMERERDILTNSPLERYHRVLGRSPQLFQEIPDKYIASYLRMSAETFSRIKKS
jgi:CRP-like cAMP-binding protein